MKKFLKKSDRAKPPTEKQVEDAMRVLRAQYYSEVRNAAWNLMEEIQDGQIESPDQFQESLDSYADSHVTMTWDAQKTLFLSDNEDAYFEDIGGNLECEGSVPYSQLAYYAFQRDVGEFISAMVNTGDWPDPTDSKTYR